MKLIQKKDGPVIFWLAAKDQTQVWIPAYILTANDAEVNFLRKINRIPEKMTFVPNDGATAFGTVVIPLGMPNISMVSEYSGGEPTQVMVLNADNGMLTPGGFAGVFAVKGNAVVFDANAAKHQWKIPPVFDNAQKPFQISSTCLYYCVADGTDGNKRAFECIDLLLLKTRK